MQKHVPFFMLAAMLFLSQAVTAAPAAPAAASHDWETLRRPQGVNCPDDTPDFTEPNLTGERLRCAQAKNGFCGQGNNVCTLQRPATATDKAGITRQILQAATRCAKVKENANSKCVAPQGSKKAPAAQEALQAACKQLQDAGLAASNANNQVGGFCQGVKSRCESFCGQAKTDIEGMITTCTDCGPTFANDPSVRDQLKALKENTAFCNTLNPNQALAQAGTTLDGSNIGQACKDLTAAAPPGGKTPGGGNSTSPQSGADKKADSSSASKGGGSAMNPAMLMGLAQMAMAAMNQPKPATPPAAPQINQNLDRVDCTVNPNLAGCPTGAAAGSDSWNVKTAAVGEAAGADSGGGFNAADEGAMKPASVDDAGGERKAGTPPTIGTIPNGGGSMPGGGGGGAASLGGGGPGGGAAPGGSKTDVLHGTSSGGGGGMSAMAANMNMKNGESGGGYTYGQGGGFGNDEAGLDLSQFLPGGKQDPSRKVAGIAAGGPANFQIQSKDVNIFSRISERIRARCSQGLLRDCIP